MRAIIIILSPEEVSVDMEKDITLITSVEANKYIWQQVKQLLATRGFILRPNKSKYMVRLREHHLQMVYQDIVHGTTRLGMIIVPAWTYQEGWFFCDTIHLQRTNTNVAGGNSYSDAAYRQNASLKTYYDVFDLVKIWDEGILPQLQKKLIEYFDSMDFNAYAGLCENRGDRILKYGSSCAGVMLFSIGYNSLWMQQYEKGEEYIKKAIIEMQRTKTLRESCGGVIDPMFALDIRKGEEILSVLENKGPDMEKNIRIMLSLLEKDAMGQNFHITLNEKNETIKKERKAEKTGLKRISEQS